MSEYWNQKYETMDQEGMRSFQLKQLQETLKWVYERVPFYTKAFDEKGVKPEDCKTLEDLRLFPFTIKKRSSRQLPLRHVRRSHERRCAGPRLIGHHRQAHYRPLHS